MRFEYCFFFFNGWILFYMITSLTFWLDKRLQTSMYVQQNTAVELNALSAQWKELCEKNIEIQAACAQIENHIEEMRKEAAERYSSFPSLVAHFFVPLNCSCQNIFGKMNGCLYLWAFGMAWKTVACICHWHPNLVLVAWVSDKLEHRRPISVLLVNVPNFFAKQVALRDD